MTNFFWDFYSYFYDTIAFLSPYQKMLQDVVSFIPNDRHLKILDAGCGTGNFLSAIRKINCEYVGIDFSEIMLRRARKKFFQEKLASFIYADINNKLPFPDNYFDVVVNINSLYMLESPEKTIREFKRVTKMNGLIILSMPRERPDMISILRSHIKEKGVMSFFLISLPLSIIALFNLIILEKGKRGAYKFFTKDELIVVCGKPIINTTYAKQNWLIILQWDSETSQKEKPLCPSTMRA